MTETTYSTREAALIAGVSYRMLDYWLRIGTVVPDWNATPGSGRQRRWTCEDVDRLCSIVACWREAERVVSDFRDGSLWRKFNGVSGEAGDPPVTLASPSTAAR